MARHFVIQQDDTDVTVRCRAYTASTGMPKTDLAFNTAGLVAYYSRGPVGAATAITLATQTATGAHSDGGFVPLSASNMPGEYRLDLPDAVVVNGVPFASVVLSGVSDVVIEPVQIDLTAYDPNAAGASTADIADAVLDEALAGHTSAGTLGKAIADIETDVDAVLVDTGTDGVVVASIAANAITATAIAADAITAAKIAAGAIDAATFAADVDAEILSYLVDDATKIDASALNTASAATGSNGAGLTEAGGTGDQLTALATAANLTTVDTVVDAIKAKTDSLTFTVAGEVDANVQSINDAALTGDGTVGTEWGPA